MKKILLYILLLTSGVANAQTIQLGQTGANGQSIARLNVTTTLGLPTASTGLVMNTAGTVSYITNNSTNWNTAYGWGNHAGLYPTYNGTGATGTWGIGITGNAGTVTNGVYTTTFNTLGDARYGQLVANNIWTGNNTLNNKTLAVYGSGVAADAIGGVGVTMPADGNSYGMIGLTRYLATAVSIGMNTSNDMVFGSSASRGIGAILNKISFRHNVSSGSTTFYDASNNPIFDISTIGAATANSFIKSGGTSNQFLKADGSVDATAYAPLASIPLNTSFYTNVGNVSTTPTDIYSYTLPANSLTTNGQFIDGSYGIRLATQALSTDQIDIKFGGQTIWTSGLFNNTTSTGARLTFTLYRTGTTTARCMATYQTGAGGTGLLLQPFTDITGVDFTTTNVLKVVATGGTTDDVVFNTGFYRVNK